MDNIEAQSADYHQFKTDEVGREARELSYDMEPFLKEALINNLHNLPTFEVKKEVLGESDEQFKENPDEPIEIQPTIFINRDTDRTDFGLNISRNSQERVLPSVVAEEITSRELKRYDDTLPRPYRGIDDKREKAWVFKNGSGNPVGWVVVHENGKEAHVGFIGVSVRHEQVRYGSSILHFLQEKYDYLGLTMLAYDTAGRGYSNASARLAEIPWAHPWVTLECKLSLS